ncbi:sensor histidine kinase [Streptomyces sp. NPDC046832]|uniref:sensor histidine kinase n=1 Tax=Streptomyces sp. NPDC046832 TaxID=3155020 RepID=UPI0033E82C0C
MARHLRFAPEILVRLGEELVPRPDLGVVELVRNSYDADANFCKISLTAATKPGGTLVVSDDGDGMTEEDIYDGFLLVGRSGKVSSQRTASGRRKVGEKGLGRLAALRLGRYVEVVTRPKSSPGVAHVLKIDWTEYESAKAVEDVPLIVDTVTTNEGHGTRVTVRELHNSFGSGEVERLARTILLLTGPFPSSTNFKAELDAPEFNKLEKLVDGSFFDEYSYRLVAELDDEGQASARLFDWRGEVVAAGDHDEVAAPRTRGEKDVPIAFFAPPARLEMWLYLLSKDAFRLRSSQVPVDGVRTWLQQVGGVHLYHRGLRVHPYGDPGHDWLDLNLRRVGSPELRPSTNNSVGRIVVDDDRQQLQPKTDRTGFVENEAFLQLRSFAMRATDWAASQRLRMREQTRTTRLPSARERMDKADKHLEEVVRFLPTRYQPLIEPAVQKFREETAERVAAVEDNLLLYRTLSTVGTSLSVFAHESLGPASRLGRMINGVERQIRSRLGDSEYVSGFSHALERVTKTAASIESFAQLPLKILTKQKRKPRDVDVDEACRNLVDLFRPYMEARRIEVRLDLAASPAVVRTTVADIEAILANFLSNAAYALVKDGAPTGPRVISVRTSVDSGMVEIAVDDSGPGISESMQIGEIWLPGRSEREEGTGLGLTIVRDVVSDLRGKYTAEANGILGGAHFAVQLPIKTAS